VTTFRAKVAAAERHLRTVEPAFGPLIDRYGPCQIQPRRTGTHFEALARSIVFQQLAGRAASAIHARFVTAVGGSVTPDAVLGRPETDLRAAGLSGAKAAAIRDLATKVRDGTVPLARLGRLPDDEVVERLSTVRGVGPWTAQMFLMFRLGRLDVWPPGDLGVRKGVAVVTGSPALPDVREMPALGARFAPWRSVAAWYCWRAVDTLTPD
jgi:3-methyladenine DNA glycosylase/8-oxoguanine DNA glycosylase